MNTNQNIINPAAQDVQPLQRQDWTLTHRDHEEIDTYGAPTGHCVTVHIIHHRECSHAHIVVSDETAVAVACNVHFDGFNHEDVCNEFVEDYLQNSDLECICKYFDALCIELGEEHVA